MATLVKDVDVHGAGIRARRTLNKTVDDKHGVVRLRHETAMATERQQSKNRLLFPPLLIPAFKNYNNNNNDNNNEGELDSWCFERSQPHRVISGDKWDFHSAHLPHKVGCQDTHTHTHTHTYTHTHTS